MTRAGIIGWPIAHSRSPLIHGSWLKKHSIAGTYERFAVKPEDLRAFLSGLAGRDLAGCNVTIPHKEAALAAADVIHESAGAVGAANTLWREGGRLHAANTDTYGFMTALSAKAPTWQHQGGPVLILGAGGAARAVVHGFIEAGVGEIAIANRTVARADELVQAFSGRGSRLTAIDWGSRQAAAGKSSVIVNTTSLGMNGEGDLDISFERADPRTVVADVVYVPLVTPILAAARAAGLVTVDGLGMLLHQAVPGFERWFGVRPEVTAELYNLVLADIEGRRGCS